MPTGRSEPQTLQVVIHMALTVDDIRQIARLARLELSAEEERLFTDQLNQLIEQVEEMGQVDTEGVPPMYHTLAPNIREDKPRASCRRRRRWIRRLTSRPAASAYPRSRGLTVHDALYNLSATELNRLFVRGQVSAVELPRPSSHGSRPSNLGFTPFSPLRQTAPWRRHVSWMQSVRLESPWGRWPECPSPSRIMWLSTGCA